jgi:hypothetical protein
MTPVVRAIIFCIRQNTGEATEQQILDFLTDYWRAILDISPSSPATPTLTFLRFCITTEKAGYFLFTRKESGRISVFGDAGEPLPHMPYNPSAGEIDARPFEATGSESRERFEDQIMFLLKSRPHGLSEPQLLELLWCAQRAPGRFAHLDFNRRLRACLLAYKAERAITFRESSGLWTVPATA